MLPTLVAGPELRQLCLYLLEIATAFSLAMTGNYIKYSSLQDFFCGLRHPVIAACPSLTYKVSFFSK
ncbi:MAG: hypothetical protein K0R52_1640 [Alphaproteobacteria bacterium]|jgi:hypothetical protein|nr:hypothetical protein [Alphaproteobacteria bacterium]